ncbi:MAG: bifunctional riboflavin kinase/FAD synthetase [Thermodesulfobacteriota bacterium]
MRIYTDLARIPARLTSPFITIGNFDGVHLGHQLLFSEVVNKAYNHKGTGVAITFNPHPLQVVRPEAGIKLISTYEQKVELIEQAGIDVLIVLPFTREFAATPAEKFVDDLLAATGITELVVGYDYAFGRGRQGDIPFLREQGRQKGFEVSVVDALHIDDKLVSSTKIRELVREGKMRTVRKLLGRYYQIRGTVQTGKRRGGAVVGFPTANLYLAEEYLCPRLGVYVVQVSYDGRCYGGVLNIGYNPTFGGEILSAETHIFDFNEDIYGKQIKINLLRFVRGEMKFAGPAELAQQIACDIQEAHRVLDEAQKELLLSCEEQYNR